MHRRSLFLAVLVCVVFGSLFNGRQGASYASPVQAPAPKALILEPFQTQLVLPSDAGNIEAQALRSAGFDVTILRNAQVTVAALETVNEYNVVYIHTHSGSFQGGDGVVATGELDNNDPFVAPLKRDGSVDSVTVSTVGGGQTTEHYYAITSTFIKNHVGLFPQHSLVFINGCGLLQAPVFYRALAGKGVGVMVSWDAEATNFDNYLAGAAFFNLMSQGMTVSAAIVAEQAAGYGVSSPSGQPKATLGYLGDGSITLAEAASGAPLQPPGPSATPIPTTFPTNTPTARPATPLPTATPHPGPPLTLSLKGLVKPGKRQVVHITSSPDTVLHITVSYPNGDVRTATTATDPQGIATFGYRQPGSEITRASSTATVRVDALKDGGRSSQSSVYRVGWAPVDISAEPRRQQVGSVVDVWVHTQPRTPLVVRMRFPRKTVVKHFKGRTGAVGWFHVTLTVGTGLKQGTDHTVFVRANVLLNGTHLYAYTSFIIV